MVQRMLAARNLRESRLALLSSGIVIFAQFTLFLLIGVGLFVFYGMAGVPNSGVAHLSPDRIFPTFIVREMPHGIAGLLVAAILAAAMSNLSAALNSLASTTVVDFYVPWRTRSAHAGSTGSVNTTLVSRIATLFWAVVLFLIAVYSIQAGGKGHVVETGLSIASVAYGSLLGVFLLGTLTRYATELGAILGMICGFALNLWLWQGTFPIHLGALTIPHIAFTWFVFLGAVATFALGSLFSLIPTRKPQTLASILLLIAAAALAQPATAQTPTDDGERTTDNGSPDFSPVSTLLNDAIAAHKLPGAVVLVGHNGHIIFEQAYGLRKLPGEPGPDGKASPAETMTEDTLFDMASLTKVLVTTTAVLQLCEQGKLKLDDPVAQYLPDFAANGKASITIRELLTHYSGLPEDVDLKDPWGLAAPDKAEGIRRALAATPYGPPGQTFKYSDINFITLGTLVETVSGQTLDAYAREHIFQPLGMSSTAYHPFDRTCGPATRIGAAIEPGPKPVGRIGVVCLPGTWSPYSLDPDTAPTAHDDEGTRATNPDFDHLLRGTVHDPTTRRMGGVAGHAGVFSTAADASRFCQALLAKLLHNTGPFPLSQATLRLATSPQQPASALSGATIFTPDGQPTKGIAIHGLGWDINTAFSRPRGTLFPTLEPGQPNDPAHPPSFGHTGFTGTSLWLDPASDTWVILLANAIHPRGNPSISALRGQVATAAARALNVPSDSSNDRHPERSGEAAQSKDPESPHTGDAARTSLPPYRRTQTPVVPPQTQTGIDVLESTRFAAFHTLAAQHGGHLRLGLVTNVASLDAHGQRTIDVLYAAAKADPTLELKTLFAPEHGLQAHQDTEHLSAEQDPATTLPILELYGPKPSDKRPRQQDLKQLDAVILDLQDAGTRFWTYETLTGYFLEACARAHIDLIVLDRPNPLGGQSVQGETSDPGTENYTNYMPLPLRHGLTLGELARFFDASARAVDLTPEPLDARAVTLGTGSPAEDDTKPAATQPGLHCNLTVIPMQHWTRNDLWSDTGLTWTPPSPNLKSPTANLLYPGVGLTEQTNISVGRGTDSPFENLGAPWIKPDELAAYLTARRIPGIVFTPTHITIAEDAGHYPFHGQTIPALHFTVTDSASLDSPELGIELLAALHQLYPSTFKLELARNLLANADTLAALKAGKDPRDVAAAWQPALAHFRTVRKPFLLY